MKQAEITINGKQYSVVFTLATIGNFEEVVNQSFFEANMNTVKCRIALIMAAAFAADENTKLTVEDIKGNEDFKAYRQISAAFSVIGELSKEFFKMTDADKQADEEEQGDKEEERNPAKN